MKLQMSEQAARFPQTKCPICEHHIDAASHVSEPGIFARPSAGDFTVCIECGGWLKFDAGLALVRLNEFDIMEMTTEEHEALRTTTQIIKRMHKQDED
jgi:hypothetical protein